jgi:hypothetical protein
VRTSVLGIPILPHPDQEDPYVFGHPDPSVRGTGSEDPYQNVTDPQLWLTSRYLIGRILATKVPVSFRNQALFLTLQQNDKFFYSLEY